MKQLIFESKNAVVYTAFVRGNFLLHYAKDPWTAIVQHFYDRRHNAPITPERVKSELFPKMPLFACKNICIKLTEMGAAEPTSDNAFQLTDKGGDIAVTGKNFQPLGDDHALALTWVNFNGRLAIVKAEIQKPDSKSKTFTPEGYDKLAEILRSPVLVKNGEATVVLTGNDPVFGSKCNGGPEEKNEKATLTLAPEKATISIGKTPINLDGFPSWDDIFDNVRYRGLKLVFDSEAGVYRATVEPDFNDEFPFQIPIKKLGLRCIQQLEYAGFVLNEKSQSVTCVPSDKGHAQKAFLISVGARLKKTTSLDDKKESFPRIVDNLKKEFATFGFHDLPEPRLNDYLVYSDTNNLDTKPSGIGDFLKSIFSLTRNTKS